MTGGYSCFLNLLCIGVGAIDDSFLSKLSRVSKASSPTTSVISLSILSILGYLGFVYFSFSFGSFYLFFFFFSLSVVTLVDFLWAFLVISFIFILFPLYKNGPGLWFFSLIFDSLLFIKAEPTQSAFCKIIGKCWASHILLKYLKSSSVS